MAEFFARSREDRREALPAAAKRSGRPLHQLQRDVSVVRALQRLFAGLHTRHLGIKGDGTPHGMGATFSTHFNAMGVSIDVIEHCLAHLPGNRVRATYNCHAYRVERRSRLQD